MIYLYIVLTKKPVAYFLGSFVREMHFSCYNIYIFSSSLTFKKKYST